MREVISQLSNSSIDDTVKAIHSITTSTTVTIENNDKIALQS